MLNLYNVLSELSGESHNEGRCYKFRSPFRNERTSSFAVYPESNTWFDFGLGEGGDVIAFFRKLCNCSYKEALCEIEACALSQQNVSRPNKKATQAFLPQVKPVIKPVKVDRYFKSQGLGLPPRTGAFMLRLKKSEYIALPCPDRSSPKGLECRLVSGEGARRLSLVKKEIWFYQKRKDHITITESIFDCLAATVFVEGDYSLCSMNGLGNKRKTIDFITRTKPRLVFLALDNDTHGAGQKVQEEMTRTFEEAGIKVEDVSRRYKDCGVKDFYRLLQKHTTEKIK